MPGLPEPGHVRQLGGDPKVLAAFLFYWEVEVFWNPCSTFSDVGHGSCAGLSGGRSGVAHFTLNSPNAGLDSVWRACWSSPATVHTFVEESRGPSLRRRKRAVNW